MQFKGEIHSTHLQLPGLSFGNSYVQCRTRTFALTLPLGLHMPNRGNNVVSRAHSSYVRGSAARSNVGSTLPSQQSVISI